MNSKAGREARAPGSQLHYEAGERFSELSPALLRSRPSWPRQHILMRGWGCSASERHTPFFSEEVSGALGSGGLGGAALTGPRLSEPAPPPHPEGRQQRLSREGEAALEKAGSRIQRDCRC